MGHQAHGKKSRSFPFGFAQGQDDNILGVRDDNFYGNVRLVDSADLLYGPVDEGGLAVDEVAVDGAEVAAVAGDGAVVAHDPVLVRREDHFGLGAVVGEALGDVGLVEQLAVDEDLAVVDAEAVAGESDDALNVAL